MIVWQAHKGRIDSAAFSPDGRLFATATGGMRAPCLWDPTSGTLVRKPAGAPTVVQTVAFAPGAPLFAAGTPLGVAVWRTDTWEVVSQLRFMSTYDLAFGPGPNPVLAVAGSHSVATWADAGAPHTGAPREPDTTYPATGHIAAVHLSSDAALLATTDARWCQLWRTADRKLLRTLRDAPTNGRGAVRFSPDDTKVAIAYGKTVEVWPVAAGDEPLLRFTAGPGRGLVWTVNWTADGKALLTASSDGFVRVWDVATGAELKSFDWGIGKLYCAAFSPDGLTCAACGGKGQVVIWDVDA